MRRAVMLGNMVAVECGSIARLSDSEAIRILLANIAPTIVEMVKNADPE
jgi:hypothetical protein